MKGGSTTPPACSHESSPPQAHTSSFCIVDDGAKGLERTCSLSFHRVVREQKHRRRTHAVDSKRISRWESYPGSHKEEKQRREVKPPRRLSPTSTSSTTEDECRYRTREAFHRVLQEVDGNSSFSCQTFTPCSTWLEVVSKHDSYSPKPAPRSAIGLQAPARIPRKNLGKETLLTASQKTHGKAAKRAAALKRNCPPRRPQRQASFTHNVKAALPLEGSDNCEATVTVSIPESQRPRRHSDSTHVHPPRDRHNNRHTLRHSIPPIARGNDLQEKRNLSQDDSTEEDSSKDQTSTECNGFCARSA